MKHIKLFNTTSEYNTFTASTEFVTPNVSLCEDAPTDIKYNPVDPYNGHEYVDLGLPSGTKWAKYNVGANAETDYGNWYQYGKGASEYAATSGQSDYEGTENPLAISADTAAQVWGGSWHMPTQAQLNELTTNTTYTWATINGVNGGKFTAKNGSGNYIFIPAAGYWEYNHNNRGLNGLVWSSSPNNSNGVFCLVLYDGGQYMDNYYRIDGCSVRPVVG